MMRSSVSSSKVKLAVTLLALSLLVSATQTNAWWPGRTTTTRAIQVDQAATTAPAASAAETAVDPTCEADMDIVNETASKKPNEKKKNKKKSEPKSTGSLTGILAGALVTLGMSMGIYIGSKQPDAKTRESLSMPSMRESMCDSTCKSNYNPRVSVLSAGFDTTLRRESGADLAFEGIKLTLSQKVKKGSDMPATRTLLDGSFRGRAKPGRMIAIMGPSGAGKSVFLHAIAGRIKADSKLTLEGDRYLNGHAQAADAVLPVAFVEQEVNFFPRMTVRETLAFRVALHFGDEMDKLAQAKKVEDLMAQLGLSICADTIVGDSKVRGISSGERKRLSIAVEMISSPDLVCCDEPTSNLDSTAAAVVVDKLRQMAVSGKTILCVIHQPSSMIFQQFDDVLLISEGKQMYFGPVFQIRRYMEGQGHLAEDETGTAEHILNCVSPIPSLWESPKEAEIRLKELGVSAEKQAQKIDLGVDTNAASCPSLCDSTDSEPDRCRTSIWTQFKLLLGRAIAENFRGKDVIMIKTMQQAVVAIIYGGIYTLGNNQASILDRFGLLSLTSIGGANMAIATALRAFPKEKTIASAEIAIRQYKALPYFAAKAISELPLVFFYNGVMGIILFVCTGMNPSRFWSFLGLLTLHSLASEASGMAVGAVSPNSDVALAVFPAILILNVIFDGRNISIENTPYLLRWVPKVSIIRWGYEGLVANEFEGLEFDTSDAVGAAASTGEEALALFGMDDASVDDAVHAELIIMAVCWCLAYVGLTLTKQKFVKMEPVKSMA